MASAPRAAMASWHLRVSKASSVAPFSGMFTCPRRGQWAAEGAEVRHRPVQVDKVQQALDEPGRLAQRHAEQHFHGQAGLDRVRRESSPPDCFLILLTIVIGLSTAFASRRGRPYHGGIKPALRRLQAIAYRPTDCQRAAALERVRHYARTNGASMAHCRPASSWSCRRWVWVCSCRPATTLDSRDESLTGFVQQSRFT